MSEWKPEKRAGDWMVWQRNEPKARDRYAVGADGASLTFWNEKSAQLKADKLNRKDPTP